MIDPLSIFLAKLLGLALLIIGIAVFSKPQIFQDTIRDVAKSNAVMTLMSVIPLIAGLAIVLSHNIWKQHWIVVITILGWWILLVGILRLFFRKELMQRCTKFAGNKRAVIWIGVIMFAVGAYLAGKAFFGPRFFF